MKKTTIATILLGLLLLAQCKSPSDSDDPGGPTDPELTGSWSTACTLDGVGGTYRIDMTFGSDGSFYREQRNFVDDTCSVPTTTEVTNKTYTAKGPSAGDPSEKLLQYLDGSDSIVCVLYQVTGGTNLAFAEDPADYPADLTGADDFDKL